MVEDSPCSRRKLSEVLIVTAATFGVSLAVMYAIKGVDYAVSGEGESHGLDLHEHGISAYPEYLISPAGQTRGNDFR